MKSTQLLLTVLVLYWAALTQQSPMVQNYTSGILRLAKTAQIKAYINEAHSPCENFYKFACGKWSKLHPAKLNHPKTSFLQQLQELYIQKSAAMLKEEHKTDNTADIWLKNFYKSCIDKQSKPTTNAIEHLLGVINFKGGWPRVEQQVWYENDYDWLKVIAQLRQELGVDIIIGLDIIPRFEEHDMQRIKIGAPQLHLGTKAMYLYNDNDSAREAYKQEIIAKLRKYFKDMPRNWAVEIAEQVLHIEQQLANGLPDNDKLTLEQTTRLRYVHELKTAYGNYVDLSRYLNLIFNQTILTQVYETPEDYMSNLVDVIKQTPKLTIANYTVWRVLDHFDKANDIEQPQSERACVEQVLKYFPQQMESIFQRHSNNMQLINELQSVWADIRRLFREDLQTPTNLNWIAADTRNKAIQKLDNIDLAIERHDDGHLQDQMFGLNLSADKYFSNLIKTIKWQTQHKLAQLHEKPQSAMGNSFVPKYDTTTNKIKIPILFLQPRFFWDPKYPHALKYSTLGILLAQEMLHAFDNVGRNHDKYGHHTASWWDTVSANAFDERAKCFSKQYQAFKEDNKAARAVNVLRTAIADNGALGLAYRAYHKWVKNAADNELGTKETLPSFNYTANQLFFINYAQMWCADYHDAEFNLFVTVETDDTFEPPNSLHDLINTENAYNDAAERLFVELKERSRVIGALANFEDFAKTFSCAVDKAPKPPNKCAIY